MVPSNVIDEAVRQTFEEMAFLDVASGPSPSPVGREEGPILFLEYSRPSRGALMLFLPKAIKFQVAEAIYGEEWTKLRSLQLDDSLLELLNVLAGRLLTHRFGPQTSYSMGLPTVLYEPPEVQALGERRDFLFHVDEQEFLLSWYEVTP